MRAVPADDAIDPVAPDGHHVHPPRPPGPVRVVVPTKRRLRLVDVWRSLAVLRVLTDRDLKARYKQSALGPIWLAIQPLGIVAAFAVAFNGVTKVDTSGVPYVLFALTGICVWSYFQMALTQGSNAIAAHATFIRRVPCPRHTLPMAGMLAALPLLASTLVFALVAVVAYGESLSWRVVLLPAVILWLVVLIWGMVGILSAVAARFRDVLGLLPFILQAGLFVTPVGYPATEGGSTVEAVLFANPLTGIIEVWRWSMLDDLSLNGVPVAIAAAWTVVLAMLGWWVFTRLEVRFADVV